jgi:hypothetical protein
MAVVEMCSLREVKGYKMMDHKCTEDVRNELGMTYIKTAIKRL